ncbi:MAG: hypothetical protein KDK30_00300 [Leptospiraceae bacterium]|nr:hypothetical protein [Leptospiraceae bacterium]MCB1315764.1 hypothetical protein [Leptospiraceae bacterium]
MGLEMYVTETPTFTTPDYRTRYVTPCVSDRKDPMDFEWYRGTGIDPQRHPLAPVIRFGACQNCESANVLVIAAQHNVHRMSGDVYYDYELSCNDCNRFTRVSFAGND